MIIAFDQAYTVPLTLPWTAQDASNVLYLDGNTNDGYGVGTYTNGGYSAWVHGSPNSDVYIYQMQEYGVNHYDYPFTSPYTYDPAYTEVIGGISNPNLAGSETAASWIGPASQAYGTPASGAAGFPGGSFTNEAGEFCLSTSCSPWQPGQGENWAYLMMYASTSYNPGLQYGGTAQTNIADEATFESQTVAPSISPVTIAPGITATPSSSPKDPTTWVKSFGTGTTITATDAGLGMGGIILQGGGIGTTTCPNTTSNSYSSSYDGNNTCGATSTSAGTYGDIVPSFSTPSWNFTAPNGEDLYGIGATDIVGNSTTQFFFVNVDNTPPQVALNPLPAASHGTITITGTASDPPAPGANASSGLQLVSVDDTPPNGSLTTICSNVPVTNGTFSCEWNTNNASTPDGNYTITAEALDNANNYAQATSPLLVDNTDPTITLNQPVNPATGTITISGSAVDNPPSGSSTDSGVADVEISATPPGHSTPTNICSHVPVASNGNYSCSWNTATVPMFDGVYTITASATDNAGNSATPATATTTVSNTGPISVTITGPAAPTSSGTTTLPATGRTLTIAATEPMSGQPGYGIQSASLSIDGTDYQDADEPCGGGPCNLGFTFNLDPASLSDGTHELTLTTTDLAGDTSVQTWAVLADNTPPTITESGTLQDNNIISSNQTYTVDASAQDEGSGVASMAVMVDGNTVATQGQTCAHQPCGLAIQYNYNPANFSSGDHQVEVQATDASGNIATDLLAVNEGAPSSPLADCGTAANSSGLGGTVDTIEQAVASLTQLVPQILADSTTDGNLAPVLSATSDGYVSSGGETSAVIGNSLASGYALGDPWAPVCVQPTQVNTNATALEPQGSAAVAAANALASTDEVERATADGVETILQLRDSQAPTSFSWTVSGQAGQTFEQVAPNEVALVQPFPDPSPDPVTTGPPSDGSPATSEAQATDPAELPEAPPVPSIDTAISYAPLFPVDTPAPGTSAYSLQDANDTATQDATGSAEVASASERINGTLVALFWAPSATDANGNSLPVTLTFQGQTITASVDISASGSAPAYPIIVDPRAIDRDELEENGSSVAYGPGPFTDQAVSCYSDPGKVVLNASTQLEGNGYVECDGYDGTLVGIRNISYCIQSEDAEYEFVGTYSCQDPAPSDVPVSGKFDTPTSVTAPCYPGYHGYRTRLSFEAYDNMGLAAMFTFYQSGSRSTDCDAAALWTEQAEAPGAGSPSTQLGNSITNEYDSLEGAAQANFGLLPDQFKDPLTDESKNPHNGTTYGFAAHHIIPVADPAGRAAMALGYVCSGLEYKSLNVPSLITFTPNDYQNGIYLRNYYYKQTTDAEAPYNAYLDGSDQSREYHPTLHTPTYYAAVAQSLYNVVSSDGACNGASAVAALNTDATELQGGYFPF